MPTAVALRWRHTGGNQDPDAVGGCIGAAAGLSGGPETDLPDLAGGPEGRKNRKCKKITKTLILVDYGFVRLRRFQTLICIF